MKEENKLVSFAEETNRNEFVFCFRSVSTGRNTEYELEKRRRTSMSLLEALEVLVVLGVLGVSGVVG